jgi:hypothetical protein
MPVPESELPLLSNLVQIRTRLTALKKDRTEYVRAADVLEIYKEVLQVGEQRVVTLQTTSKSLS